MVDPLERSVISLYAWTIHIGRPAKQCSLYSKRNEIKNCRSYHFNKTDKKPVGIITDSDILESCNETRKFGSNPSKNNNVSSTLLLFLLLCRYKCRLMYKENQLKRKI